MVTAAVLGVFANLISFICGLFPTWSEPSWVDPTANTMTGWLANVGALGYFVPLPAIQAGCALIIAAIAIAFGIRAMRIIQSSFTGGGGSAG